MLTVYKLRHFPTGGFYDRNRNHSNKGPVYITPSTAKDDLARFKSDYDWHIRHGARWVGDAPDEYELVTYELVEVMSERIHLEDLS